MFNEFEPEIFIKSFISTSIASLDANFYNLILRSVWDNQNTTYTLEDDSDSAELVGFDGNEDKTESNQAIMTMLCLIL